MVFFKSCLMWLMCGAIVAMAMIARAQDAGGLNDRVTAAFQRVFGADVSLQYKEIPLDDSAVSEIKQLSRWRYGKTVALHYAVRNGKTLGYGIVDDVRGKEQRITYIVFVAPDLTVKDLEVLFYREAYGGEIQNDSWRAQFRGKTPSSNLQIGNDIENISGATISTNAVTSGVHKLMAVYTVLQERKLLP